MRHSKKNSLGGHPLNHHLHRFADVSFCTLFELPRFGLGLIQPLFHLSGSLGLDFVQPGMEQVGGFYPDGLYRPRGLLPGPGDGVAGPFLCCLQNLLRLPLRFEQTL